MNSPCKDCKHFYEEQIEQTLYQAECEEGAPTDVFMSEWGCWMYQERSCYSVWKELD